MSEPCPLTRRELQILREFGEGNSEDTVRTRLKAACLSPAEVFSQICDKLGVSNIIAACMIAAKEEWVVVERLTIRESETVLSPAQQQVLRAKLDGKNVPQIAQFLGMSVSAVENHLVYARRKLQTTSSELAAVRAHERGLLG